MDGNRRWASERGLKTVEGHQHGFEKLEEVVRWAEEERIQELTVYAFSSENWNRSSEEVSCLMDLFRKAVTHGLKEKAEHGRIRFIGNRTRLSEELVEAMAALEKRTENNTGGTLVIALSYGGQDEVLAAIEKATEAGVGLRSKEELKKYMWSAGLLDPDLIIRTGGEQRLSNFLTFQSAYSELHFTETHWPAFSKEEFISILTSYRSRERRFGS